MSKRIVLMALCMVFGFGLPARAVPLPATGNLVYHLKSTTITGANLDGLNRVTQWNDTVGGNHAMQSTAGARPLYVASVPELLGKPAVRFDGSMDQFLTSGDVLDSVFSGNDQQFTIVAYFANASSNAGEIGGVVTKYQSSTAPTGWEFSLSASTAGPFTVFASQSNNSIYRSITTTGSLTSASRMILMSYDGTQTVSAGSPWAQLGVNLDGVTTFNTVLNNGTWNNSNDLDDSNGPLNIGGLVDSGGTHTFNGDLAEVLIYDRLLSSGELSQLSNYFDVEYVTGPFIPEPSTLVLFALGMSVMCAGRRRAR